MVNCLVAREKTGSFLKRIINNNLYLMQYITIKSRPEIGWVPTHFQELVCCNAEQCLLGGQRKRSPVESVLHRTTSPSKRPIVTSSVHAALEPLLPKLKQLKGSDVDDATIIAFDVFKVEIVSIIRKQYKLVAGIKINTDKLLVGL